MHGHVDPAVFLKSISGFLGSYYLVLAAMNAIAAYYCWDKLKKSGLAIFMLCLTVFFVIISPLAFSGNPTLMQFISVPESIRNFVDIQMAKAPVYTGGTLLILIVMFVGASSLRGRSWPG